MITNGYEMNTATVFFSNSMEEKIVNLLIIRISLFSKCFLIGEIVVHQELSSALCSICGAPPDFT